jgi:hypothetical protein
MEMEGGCDGKVFILCCDVGDTSRWLCIVISSHGEDLSVGASPNPNHHHNLLYLLSAYSPSWCMVHTYVVQSPPLSVHR